LAVCDWVIIDADILTIIVRKDSEEAVERACSERDRRKAIALLPRKK